MLTIELKQLGNSVAAAVSYLRTRLDEQVKAKGTTVTLTDTNARAARRLLQKFLHQFQLEGYRILVVRSGLIEVRAAEKEKRRPVRASVGSTPSAWETVPDLWYQTPPGIIRKGKRSKREMKRAMRGL